MSTRNSGYARQAHDRFVTPLWCLEALYRVEPSFEFAYDCAPATDPVADFLTQNWIAPPPLICSNPPYKLATEFCRRAIEVTRPVRGAVAFLLPVMFDCAKTRQDLWEPPFKRKLILTRRIRWLNVEQRPTSPSSNHCWAIWDWAYSGPPTMGWLT